MGRRTPSMPRRRLHAHVLTALVTTAMVACFSGDDSSRPADAGVLTADGSVPGTDGAPQPDASAPGDDGAASDAPTSDASQPSPDASTSDAAGDAPPPDSGGADASDAASSGTCNDGIKDNQETDVDCGGPVCDAANRRCQVGRGCATGNDCITHSCDGTVCLAATCSDGVENGNETDVDCGGPVCDAMGKRCATGQKCLAATDCQILICDAGNHCPAPSCHDGVKDGNETGVDCG